MMEHGAKIYRLVAPAASPDGPDSLRLTSTLTWVLDLNGNVDVDSIVDLARRPPDHVSFVEQSRNPGSRRGRGWTQRLRPGQGQRLPSTPRSRSRSTTVVRQFSNASCASTRPGRGQIFHHVGWRSAPPSENPQKQALRCEGPAR